MGPLFRDLGYCFVKLGDIDQAMQMYQKSVDLDGKDWEAYRGSGRRRDAEGPPDAGCPPGG